MAIAKDLQRLTADLDRVCRSDKAVVSVALEDARYALIRAVIAVREAMAATVVAARPSATNRWRDHEALNPCPPLIEAADYSRLGFSE